MVAYASVSFTASCCRSEARAACDAAEYCVETQVDAGSLGRGRTACRLFKQSKPDMRVLQAMLHRIIEDGKVLVSRSLTDNVEVMSTTLRLCASDL